MSMDYEKKNALLKALSKYDDTVSHCPANKRFLGPKPCPSCGATREEGCKREIIAAFECVDVIRSTLTQGPDDGTR